MKTEEIYSLYSRSAGVTTDSRQDCRGKIFFALKGLRFNGHNYVKQAIDEGCLFAVIDDSSFSVPDRTVLVEDALSALQELAAHHRGLFDIPVVAITGSNGKTTTKELMRDVLCRKLRTLATEGNLNNHIGVPLTLLRLTKEHEVAVIEMGANHIGEIDMLCRIARPSHGLITNIGLAHLEGFGSPGGVFTAKGELFRYLKETGGMAFVNDNQELLKRLAAELEIESVHYGSGGEVYTSGRLLGQGNGLEMEIAAGNPTVHYRVRSNLAGGYNFENILAAVCVGTWFGVPAGHISAAIGDYLPGNNRSQIRHTSGNKLLLDAYNANPDSMQSALLNFASLPGQNKSVILGDMLELGHYAEDEHIKIVKLLEEFDLSEVILVGTIFCSIPLPGGYACFENTGLLMSWLKDNPLAGRFILLKGSRGIELERCLPLL